MPTRLSRTLAFAALLPFTLAAARGDFRTVHGQTADGYRSWLKEAAAAGYRPVYVAGSDVGGEPRFAGVAVKDAVAAEAPIDLTADDYRKTADALTRKGYRPLCVSGYLAGDAPRFAGVWARDGKATRAEVHLDLTPAEYADRVTALQKQGLRPDVVSGYADGKGGHRFAALFVAAGDAAWVARHDLTLDEYQKLFDEHAPRGYRQTTIAVYPTDAGPRYAAVFVQDRAAWVVLYGLSETEYQGRVDGLAKKGYRPLSIAAFAEGKATDVEAFDPAVRKYMKERGIPAGTLAVSRAGKLLLARGYGFADAAKRRPVRPEDPFRLASVSKPITAAAVRDLVRQGKLSFDTKAFPLLGLKPPAGQKPDPRLNDITVRHLLEHKGGWDAKKTFDPVFRTAEISQALGKAGPADVKDLIRYMMGQPLQFDPGSRESYSNFGYVVLGRVVEKVTGETYVAHVRKLLAPLGIHSIDLARTLPRDRNPREPRYVDPGRGRYALRPGSTELVAEPDGTFSYEALDAAAGLIASAVDLTRFLDAYWISGEPRQGGVGVEYTFVGSLPGTYTLVLQRPNGVNVAALFDQRADPSGLDYDKLESILTKVADGLASADVRYAAVWVKDE